MLIECDSSCANYGCKRAGAIGCAAHTEPVKPEQTDPADWIIYVEAVLFLAAIVMAYVCIVTWGTT